MDENRSSKRKVKYRDPSITVLISRLAPGSSLVVHKNFMPKKPKAGEMFVFEFDSSVYAENWRTDEYLWKADGSGKPKFNDIECTKVYHKLRVKVGETDDCYTWDFCKRVLFCPLYPNRVLIWYMGNEKAAISLSHGNTRVVEGKEEKEYTRTNASTKLKIKGEVKNTEKTPLLIHEKLLRSDNPDELPRNLAQVQNFHKSAKKNEGLHYDCWYALHEFYMDYPFISDIKTVPSLIVICYTPGNNHNH